MIEPGVITFNCDGAMDFTEQVCIELLGEPREGFTEINPSIFMQQTYLPHLHSIMHHNIFMIFNRIPDISDRNPNVEGRWKVIYYKCYRKYHHSHDWGRDSKINPLTLKKAMDYIKKHKLDLHLTEKALNKRFSLQSISDKNMDRKRRLLDCCCTLEDAITVAAITEYPEGGQEIRNVLDYVMDHGNITTEELSLYQINKLNETS